MLLPIAAKYQQMLESTEPYILTFPGNLPEYNLCPFGREIPRKNILSCVDARNAVFFNLLQRLDTLSFGPVGMPMEKWVFFDCGEMPGGIFGLGISGDKLTDEILNKYQLDKNYKGLVPISMYIAIPMANRSSWFGHNLCSANSFLDDSYAFSGLALLTKAFGVKVFNIRDCYGATQWESGALNIHTQLADMEVISAYTPAHSFSETMTYKSTYTDELLLNALSDKKREAGEYDLLVNVKDRSFIEKLQEQIISGERFAITGRPIYKGQEVFLPLKKLLNQ